MLNDEIFKFTNSDNELYFIISISSLFHSRPVIVFFSIMIFFYRIQSYNSFWGLLV